MSRLVLLAGWYYPESLGGTEAYVHALATDLQQRGHSVTLAAPSVDEQEHEYEYDGVSVYRYPVAQQPTRDEAQGKAEPAFIDVFAQWLAREQPDIVHSHSLTRGCGPYHLQEVAKAGIPYLVTVHTPHVVCGRGTLMRWGSVPCDGAFRPARCAACCMQHRGLPRVAAWPLAFGSWPDAPAFLPNAARTVLGYRGALQMQYERTMAALARAERVIAVSKWLFDALDQSGVSKSKLRLSRQGIPIKHTSASRGRVQNARFRIGYVGRFDPVKGVDVLIRAFVGIPQERAIELHLFGIAQGEEGAAYLAKLRELASRDSRVVFRGSLAARDRQRELAQLDLLAVPSVWFETGPLVVLEAFAAGVPVLGSDLGGIPERVVHNESGWLVPPGDVRKWRAAIEQLYRRWQSSEWRWQIPAARTSSTVADEMNELYRDIMDTARPPEVARP